MEPSDYSDDCFLKTASLIFDQSQSLNDYGLGDFSNTFHKPAATSHSGRRTVIISHLIVHNPHERFARCRYMSFIFQNN